jgi:hypothetical protein
MSLQMRTLVVVFFWVFIASVSVKAHRVDKRRGRRRNSERIADSIHMLSTYMEHATSSMAAPRAASPVRGSTMNQEKEE